MTNKGKYKQKVWSEGTRLKMNCRKKTYKRDIIPASGIHLEHLIEQAPGKPVVRVTLAVNPDRVHSGKWGTGDLAREEHVRCQTQTAEESQDPIGRPSSTPQWTSFRKLDEIST